MPPFLKFIIRRLLVIPVAILIITALLYAVVMFTPPEQRAQLYLHTISSHLTEAQLKALIDRTIVRYQLDQPYPVQYVSWLGGLLRGEWGWSPALRTAARRFSHCGQTPQWRWYPSRQL